MGVKRISRTWQTTHVGGHVVESHAHVSSARLDSELRLAMDSNVHDVPMRDYMIMVDISTRLASRYSVQHSQCSIRRRTPPQNDYLGGQHLVAPIWYTHHVEPSITALRRSHAEDKPPRATVLYCDIHPRSIITSSALNPQQKNYSPIICDLRRMTGKYKL